MFFILSKLLVFLIQPLNWVIGLMIYALFVKQPIRKRRALAAAVILALFFTNRLVFNQFAKLWEVKTITADQIDRPYDIGILLGGYSNSFLLPMHDRMNFSYAANRFLNAYELYKTGKVKKLLLTGGSGDLLGKDRGEAVKVKEFLLRTGVPPEDIIMENESRNTRENAVFTRQILRDSYPEARCLLITSAWHMRRSIGCFKKAEVDCTPFSVDFMTEKDRWAPENSLIPNRTGFMLWDLLIREWVGYLAYSARGYL